MPHVTSGVIIASLAAVFSMTALAGCAGDSRGAQPLSQRVPPQGAGARATEPPELGRHVRSAPPSMFGPPLIVYKLRHIDGYKVPGSAFSSDAAAFNLGVYDGPTPSPKFLLSQSSTFGGNAGAYTELTNVPLSEQYNGVTLVTCQGAFPNIAPSGECLAAAGSVVGPSKVRVREFAAVQSWPLYVGAGESSNLPPGQYGLTSTSDDGSYISIGPVPFTYSQPGNFQGATGLTAGTAVVPDGGEHAPTTVSGSVTIAAGSCAANVYWLTFEWYELLGGLSGSSYGWMLPGTDELTQVTQAVLWGQVTTGGSPSPNVTVMLHAKGEKNAKLLTDANGCYGYDYLPLSTDTKVTVTAVASSSQQIQHAVVSNGSVTQVNFAF